MIYGVDGTTVIKHLNNGFYFFVVMDHGQAHACTIEGSFGFQTVMGYMKSGITKVDNPRGYGDLILSSNRDAGPAGILFYKIKDI